MITFMVKYYQYLLSWKYTWIVVDIYWTNMSDCLTSIGFEKRFWFITAFWDMKASFSRGSYIYLWDAWNTLFLLQHSHLIITTIQVHFFVYPGILLLRLWTTDCLCLQTTCSTFMFFKWKLFQSKIFELFLLWSYWFCWDGPTADCWALADHSDRTYVHQSLSPRHQHTPTNIFFGLPLLWTRHLQDLRPLET